MNRRMVAGIALCCLLPASFGMIAVEQRLLAQGVLNTKDLAPFVGNEPGTVFEHALNVWHWDAVVFAGILLAVPASMVGIWWIATSGRHSFRCHGA